MYILIDPSLDTPIYKQIADHLSREITMGRLRRGAKLPTVRALANRLGIAKGTIERAYDELARMGFVEMKQGQGTFVIYDKPSKDSRKERAMATIDRLLAELEELHFSPAEMSIFFELKLRERMQVQDETRVVLLGGSPELLFSMAEQVYELGGVDVFSQVLDGSGNSIGSYMSGADLLISADGIVGGGNSNERLIEVAVGVDADTVAAFARLSEADTVATIALSERHLDEMLKSLRRYAPNADLRGITLSEDTDIEKFIEHKTVLVVPDGYSSMFPAASIVSIRNSGLPIIRCRICMDAGSMLLVRAGAESARARRKNA